MSDKNSKVKKTGNSRDGNYRFETRAIHIGQEPDPLTGAVIPPVYLVSTYAQKYPGEHKGYEYSRTKNPTRDGLERSLACLEGGQFAYAFSSGCAAMHSILTAITPPAHIVASNDLYGGTYRLFEAIFKPYGINVTYTDTTDISNIEKAITKNTKMIWIETPSNPLLKLTDIEEVSKIAKKNGLISVVDNTFASPYVQNPLQFGIDIVIHSSTKYLGGHSDLIGGVVITNDEKIAEKIKFIQNAVGAIPSPFECWLIQRSLKTLAIRMKIHSENAIKIAEFLSENKYVKKVYYPTLSSRQQVAIMKKQMRLPGGMVSFELDADEETTKMFCSKTRVFALAESLGGVESLIDHVVSMTHAYLSRERQKEMGLYGNLVRLSVGIENVEDLIGDLENAFKATFR